MSKRQLESQKEGPSEEEDDELSSTEEEVLSKRRVIDGDTGPKKRKKTMAEENNRAEFKSFNQDDHLKNNNNNNSSSEINQLKAQLELATNEIYFMKETMNDLIEAVSTIQQTVLDIKDVVERNNPLSMEPISPKLDEDTTSDLLIPAKFASVQGPFPKYTQMDRTLPRPSAKEVAETLGGKEHSLQFTSNLYVDLIEKVLGPQEENPQLDYRAMVKEAIMITKAVVSHVKETHRIDPELRWSYIDPTVKLETYKILESATEHLLPLKVCLEYWGAHVLISNFWVKRRKYISHF
ncbi:hypothetical protein G6F58_011233 [Rhizopus delemar]|nr:hypothetical protein G6F58_011233 [Rhizopus delemar]